MQEFLLIMRHEDAGNKVSPEQMQAWMQQTMDRIYALYIVRAPLAAIEALSPRKIGRRPANSPCASDARQTRNPTMVAELIINYRYISLL